MVNRSMYEDVCQIKCTDNDKVVEAEVLSFNPGKTLTVTINRSVKLSMIHKESITGKKYYLGSMTGLEFITDGPKEIIFKEGRR